ncbi:MAG: glycosyltransferase [Synechococcaceae bacterium WB8_1B_136]|nr:glycosyltransferase [Synechococcaceae bacterium WB8_1B_136]
MAALAPLAVVIPALQEAQRLPALLADLAQAPAGLIAEIVVVDGASPDGTAALAQLAGAKVLTSPAGRGLQLARGVAATTAPWLLLLHADARLLPGWAERVQAAITAPGSGPPRLWCFDLRVQGASPGLRLLELAVALRTRLRQLPYGDQGLLLSRGLLEACGGIAPLPLMEDLDLVLRLRRRARVQRLGGQLRVDGRRWRQRGLLSTAWRNACLRRQWRQGRSVEELAERYYAPGPTSARSR